MTTSTTLNTSERFAARSFLQAIIDAGGAVDTNGLDLNASAVAETARLAGGETVRIMRGTASRAAVLNALVDAGAITITVGDRGIPRRIEAHTDNVADVDATIPPVTERKTRPMVLTKHRRAILTTLAEHGPFVDEQSGQATAALMTAVGYPGDDTASFGLVLRYLAAEGMIERDTRGRRTYRIDLTPAGRTLATTLAPEVGREVMADSPETHAEVMGFTESIAEVAAELPRYPATVVVIDDGIADDLAHMNGDDGDDGDDYPTFDRCPRCDSPAPNLHPAMQSEGEVQPCPHPWHGNAPKVVDRRAEFIERWTEPTVPTIDTPPGITAHDIAIELLNAAAAIINHPPTTIDSDELDELKARHAAEIDELVTRLAKQVEHTTAQANDLRKVRAELADAGDTIRALRIERDGLRARAQRVEAQLDQIVRNDARIATTAYQEGVNDAIDKVMKAKPTNH